MIALSKSGMEHACSCRVGVHGPCRHAVCVMLGLHFMYTGSNMRIPIECGSPLASCTAHTHTPLHTHSTHTLIFSHTQAYDQYDPDLVVSVHPLMQDVPLRVLRTRMRRPEQVCTAHCTHSSADCSGTPWGGKRELRWLGPYDHHVCRVRECVRLSLQPNTP